MANKVSVQIFHAPIYMNESRLLKTCNSLLNLNLVSNIHVIGYWMDGLNEEEKINNQINVFRVKTLVKALNLKPGVLRKIVAVLSLIQYHIGVIAICRKVKPDYVSCHNLQMLPLCVLVKVLTGSKLLYEPHELESEKTGISGVSKKIFKAIERLFIGSCDKIVTVCEPITQDYIKRYNLNEDKIFTIRNVPVNPTIGVPFKRSNILREKFNIPDDCLIYIYQGLIDRYRGIENYLKTFSALGNKHHLVLMGYGDDVNLVNEYANRYSNIHYQPAVSVPEIINYTSSADIGLFIIPGNISLSYKYALPNKFYEYAIAGLYICVSDNFEYLSKIVIEEELGTIIKSNETDLLTWINSSAKSNREDVALTDENLVKRSSYGWQNEEKIFCQVYQ